MKRRGFLIAMLNIGVGFSILPSAVSYRRIWKPWDDPEPITLLGYEKPSNNDHLAVIASVGSIYYDRKTGLIYVKTRERWCPL